MLPPALCGAEVSGPWWDWRCRKASGHASPALFVVLVRKGRPAQVNTGAQPWGGDHPASSRSWACASRRGSAGN